MNAETLLAMKKGAGALKDIHKQLNIDKVDATMDEIREEMERTKEIAEAISNPINVGVDVDEVRFCLVVGNRIDGTAFRMSLSTNLRIWSRKY